jgi:hypothetical protein
MFGLIKQNTGRKNVFIRTCKAIHERIQQNIKAKRKNPILDCTANQLIEVKVSFAFGYIGWLVMLPGFYCITALRHRPSNSNFSYLLLDKVRPLALCGIVCLPWYRD